MQHSTQAHKLGYRGASLIRNRPTLGLDLDAALRATPLPAPRPPRTRLLRAVGVQGLGLKGLGFYLMYNMFRHINISVKERIPTSDKLPAILICN